MLKILCIFSSLFSLVLPQADVAMGEGMWSLINIDTCDEEMEAEILHAEIKRHKLNRTHDGITATMDVDSDVDDSSAILIRVCKYVDGGCKRYQIISDDSVVNLAYRYAKENVKRAFGLAGVETEDFPLVVGHYELKDFMIDYCEFPTKALYGKFEAEVFLIQKGEKVACLKFVVEFSKQEDDDGIC